MLLGVDVGGTFTDAVLHLGERIVTAKAPSTPADQSRGVMDAVRVALGRADRPAGEVRRFAHGMTVATNALLEGRTARTALIATEGFTDLVALGRQARPELYRLCVAHPAPLVGPELRHGAPERMGPRGVLRPLADADARSLCAAVAGQRPESVAVVLLHAYRDPAHERMLGRALRAALPEAHVSLSHEVTATFREYERAVTTEVDAALSPLVGGYLRRLIERARAAGLPEPAIMQSNGGLVAAPAAAGHAAWTVLSGPAGGAAGAAFAARLAGAADALCFDMGGTSCDVCVVQDGQVRETASREVAGRPLALPMLDVHTVGAGGGSIAWRDAGGALRVGPRSAGAEPGPACYGRGGQEPTVTDANLVLGLLPAEGELAGGVRLDGGAARRAVTGLGRELGLDPEACARGIVRVADAEMVRALRVMTVSRGVDPRGFALLAFGGAGGLHAAAIAAELGMRRVLLPRASGVLSALGMVVSPRRRDAQRSVLLSGSRLTAAAVSGAASELAAQASAALDEEDPRLRAVYHLRYRGQAFELEVPGPLDADPGRLRAAFAAAHDERYGFRDDEGEVELVTVRVTATVPGPAARMPAPDVEAPAPTRREAWLGDRRVQAAVWHGELPEGARVQGPAICELPDATLAVPPGWSGEVDGTGTLAIER